MTLDATGRTAEALAHLWEAAQLRPGSALLLTRMAWLLATHPDPNVRRPDKATHLARRAAQTSGEPSATVLDTLGAAYAAAGRFDQAVATAEAVLDRATADRAEQLGNQIRQQLQLYRQSRPYRRPLRAPGSIRP